MPGSTEAQVRASQSAADPSDIVPEPAVPAILEALQRYEVVALPAAHGEKDTDDLILSLLRHPRFATLVNDIVVECGNQRYQPVLDRYIAGEDVPFPEVEHVWRDTTVQQMCGASAFYEQLFPLVRALNQQLPAANRLRVVAADPPIDWSKINSYRDLTPFFDRDGSIASVMEREVLSKHRKALMLFGVFHLLHGGGPGQGDAVTRFERDYPGKTFVISVLGYYGTGDHPATEPALPDATWPALFRTKDSRLGSLSLEAFLPSPLTTDRDCNVVDAFAGKSTRPVRDQIDAFLYFGPQQTQLLEPVPADIALDGPYRAEWLRRMKLVGLPGPATLDELNAQVVAGAGNPFLAPPPRQHISPEVKHMLQQECLKSKAAAGGKVPEGQR